MRKYPPLKYWLATIGLVALLSACASPTTPAGPASGTAGTPTAPTLQGTSWVVTGISGGATLADHRPTMAFTDGRVSGLASCNQFSAGYTQAGTVLKFETAAQTAMACSPDTVMAQELTFTTALNRVAGVRASASGLDLLDAAGTVVMTLEAAATVPTKQLEGTTWQLSGVSSGGAVSSPVADTSVTFSITGDELTGKACNTFRGQIRVDGDKLSVGPIASTKMACGKPGEMEQEQKVLNGIQAATTFAIVGDALTLKAADGTSLEFRAA